MPLTVLESPSWLGREAVSVVNPEGRGAFVLVCDHASNWIPPSLVGLGLPPCELERHIAWDPGALALASRMSVLLDAPLVHATISRLVLDVNRDPAHPGLVVSSSEDTIIPGNRELTPEDRSNRLSSIYQPYHQALARVIAGRVAPPRLVSIHSFTPVFRGVHRPWHIGVLSAEDRRLADPLLKLLREQAQLHVGDNQPYAPTDGVYHTLEKHCSRCCSSCART
jgi:predicted N-formylglutamate amidohydrolase